jgi:hypothetical protein
MPFCPSCGAEFRAGFIECNSCLVPLVASLEDFVDESGSDTRAAHVDHDEDDLKLLASFNDEGEIVLARRLLDEGGVPSVVHGGHAQNVGACNAFQLFVDEDYVDAARETLAAYQSPSLVTGQIEGQLVRLQQELIQVERRRRDLGSEIQSVRDGIERLKVSLQGLNHRLEDEDQRAR